MKIIGAVTADVSDDFFHSLGEHAEVQHHAPEDFDYDQAIARIATAEAELAQVNTNTQNIASNSTAIGTNQTAIGTKTSQDDHDEVANTVGDLEDFFEASGNAFTGKIRHATKNEVVIENLRAVESAVGTNPQDGGQRGFLLTTGHCTEKLKLIQDGRVEMVHQVADPAVSPADGSQLQWSYGLGAQKDATGADRHKFDGLSFVHTRLDENEDERSDGEQTDLQKVTLRASKSAPSLYIEARSKDANVDILEIKKDTSNYFIVDRNGNSFLSKAYIARDIDFWNSQGNIRASLDDSSLKFYTEDPNVAETNWAVRLSSAGIQYPTDVPVAGDPSRRHALQVGSAVHDPKSVYIGNSRYSYDMTNRAVQLHKLKANHIPVYLQASTSASDLPSGHNMSHMTVNKWIDFARSHLNDDTLDVHDVFPYANADWDAADAPNPAYCRVQCYFRGHRHA